jgi:hypothetical protein
MKLIYCPICNDVFNLTYTSKACLCKKSFGYYKDNINAVISKTAIPIGFTNISFLSALKSRPEAELGCEFKAFVMPKQCNSIKLIGE